MYVNEYFYESYKTRNSNLGNCADFTSMYGSYWGMEKMNNLLTFIEAFGLSALYVIIPVSLVILLGWHPALVFFGWAVLTGLAIWVLEMMKEEDE
jgi:hypothetical protein